MKKRWLINLILLFAVAGLAAFLHLRPQKSIEATKTFEISQLKMSDFNAIKIEFPTRAPTSFEKINGFWRMTAPHQARADQPSVQRILSIIAAQSTDKLPATDLSKYGLDRAEVKLKLIKAQGGEEALFVFGTYNPVTEAQYVQYKDTVYLLPNSYSEAASTQPIELIDKKPIYIAEKIIGFDFSKLEQWIESRLQVDTLDGKWLTNHSKAKLQQDEMNEWLDSAWIHGEASSVEVYLPKRQLKYPSLEVKLKDGKKIHFDKISEAPELLLGRPDEGIIYHFSNDTGYVMLNPPLHIE